VTAFRPFHLAIPVADLERTRAFYVEVLGCRVGRASDTWLDFDFFGHQVSAHLKPAELRAAHTNPVDGKAVPVRHFGLILSMEEWEGLAARLRAHGVEFLIEPGLRFRGEVGEQATLFLSDPSGNALEFKAFASPERIFAR
jgi:uncharacterized protein